jgi:hypothetical protein
MLDPRGGQAGAGGGRSNAAHPSPGGGRPRAGGITTGTRGLTYPRRQPGKCSSQLQTRRPRCSEATAAHALLENGRGYDNSVYLLMVGLA